MLWPPADWGWRMAILAWGTIMLVAWALAALLAYALYTAVGALL